MSMLKHGDVSGVEKSIHKFKIALDSFSFKKQTRNEIWRGVYYLYSARLHIEKKNMNVALNNLEKSRSLFTRNNDSNEISVKEEMATVFFK